MELVEKLKYLTLNETWHIMADLKLPYCTFETTEKENLQTKEKVTAPLAIPRTDIGKMQEEIVEAYSTKLNREGKRNFLKNLDKKIKKRITQEGEVRG